MGNLRMRLPMLLSLAALVSAVVALILAIGACRQPAAEVVVVDEAGRVRVRLGVLGDNTIGLGLYDANGRRRGAFHFVEALDAASLEVKGTGAPYSPTVTVATVGTAMVSLGDEDGRFFGLTPNGPQTFLNPFPPP